MELLLRDEPYLRDHVFLLGSCHLINVRFIVYYNSCLVPTNIALKCFSAFSMARKVTQGISIEVPNQLYGGRSYLSHLTLKR